MNAPLFTTAEALRAAIASTIVCSAQELQDAVGQVMVATAAELPIAVAFAPEERSVSDPATRTLVLLVDRIPQGQEAQILASEIERHHGRQVAQSVLGARADELLGGPQSVPMLEDQFTFSPAAIDCFKKIGVHVFSEPLASHPWGGRQNFLARRAIYQKYLNDEDVVLAHWHHQQAQKTDPNWFAKDPGMSFLARLMDDRSGGRWRDEQEAIAKASPGVLDWMKAEWGDETRAAAVNYRHENASRRRAEMHVIASQPDPVSRQQVVWSSAALPGSGEAGASGGVTVAELGAMQCSASLKGGLLTLESGEVLNLAALARFVQDVAEKAMPDSGDAEHEMLSDLMDGAGAVLRSSGLAATALASNDGSAPLRFERGLKVPVATTEQAAAVQKALFELGCGFQNGHGMLLEPQSVELGNAPLAGIHVSRRGALTLTFQSDRDWFDSSEDVLVPAEVVLAAASSEELNAHLHGIPSARAGVENESPSP